MKKQLLWIILGILLLSTTVFAAEDRVLLNNVCSYDRSDHMFVYRLTDSGAEVRSNIVDTMVTTQPVIFQVPSGVSYTLYYEGKQVNQPDLSQISVPGHYVLDLSSNPQNYQSLRFTIVSAVTGALDEYRMPDGFAVTEVLQEGNAIPFGVNVVDLTWEGSYQITYYCQATAMPYYLNITVDHTPPTLALEAVEKDVAKGPVDLSDLEEGATLYIERDGTPLRNTTRLTESGAYVVTVTDRAGNSTTYKFRIQMYFNISSTVFVVLIAAAVAGITGYLLISRKRMRIR